MDIRSQKAIQFDVHGIINNEILFVIEVQRQGNREEVLKRMEYYASRLLAGQKLQGRSYKQIKAVWLILIADFHFFSKPGSDYG